MRKPREDLRLRRKALGWTQKVLARRADVNTETVSRLERGEDTKETTLSALMSALRAGEQERADLPRHAAVIQTPGSLKAGDDVDSTVDARVLEEERNVYRALVEELRDELERLTDRARRVLDRRQDADAQDDAAARRAHGGKHR